MCRVTYLVVISSFLAIHCAFGVNYYVSTTGSDTSGDGSQAHPFATLAHAGFQLSDYIPAAQQPGSTICLMSGTYNNTDVAYVRARGTASNPVMVTSCSEKAGDVILTENSQQPVPAYVLQLDQTSYTIVSNLTFQNLSLSAIEIGSNPDSNGYIIPTNNVTVQNCTFKNLGVGTDGEYGIVANDATYLQILNNTMDTMGGLIDGSSGEYGNGEHIYFSNVSYSLIEGNQLYRAPHASITLDQKQAGNTIYGNSQYNFIINNHIEQHMGGGIYVNNNSAYNVVDGNQVYYAGEGTTYGKAGILVEGNQNLIRRNIIAFTGTKVNNVQVGLEVDGIRCIGCTGLSSSVGNRLYNNDVYQSGGFGAQLESTDNLAVQGNIFLNNIFYANDAASGPPDPYNPSYHALALYFSTYHSPNLQWTMFPNGNNFLGNIIGYADSSGNLIANSVLSEYVPSSTAAQFSTLQQLQTNYPRGFSGNLEVKPNFAGPSSLNFALVAGSPGIDAGVPLTKTTAAGTNTTVVPVQDASYFTAGLGIMPGDVIRIANGNPVSVTAVSTNPQQITISAAITFSANSGVFTNYSGVGPDIGALESAQAYSVNWQNMSVGNWTTDSSFSSLVSWRLETRLHNIIPRLPSETQNEQYAWVLSGFGSLYITPDASTLIMQNLAEGNNAYCSVALGGLTDVVVRVQREGNNSSYSLQAWNFKTGMSLTTVGSCGSAGATPPNLSGKTFTLGGTYYNTQNYESAMAFARFYNTANIGVTMPSMIPGGELIRYEFESAANLGADTSGNSPVRNLTIVGMATQIPTP